METAWSNGLDFSSKPSAQDLHLKLRCEWRHRPRRCQAEVFGERHSAGPQVHRTARVHALLAVKVMQAVGRSFFNATRFS